MVIITILRPPLVYFFTFLFYFFVSSPLFPRPRVLVATGLGQISMFPSLRTPHIPVPAARLFIFMLELDISSRRLIHDHLLIRVLFCNGVQSAVERLYDVQSTTGGGASRCCGTVANSSSGVEGSKQHFLKSLMITARCLLSLSR